MLQNFCGFPPLGSDWNAPAAAIKPAGTRMRVERGLLSRMKLHTDGLAAPQSRASHAGKHQPLPPQVVDGRVYLVTVAALGNQCSAIRLRRGCCRQHRIICAAHVGAAKVSAWRSCKPSSVISVMMPTTGSVVLPNSVDDAPLTGGVAHAHQPPSAFRDKYRKTAHSRAKRTLAIFCRSARAKAAVQCNCAAISSSQFPADIDLGAVGHCRHAPALH